MTIKPRPDFLRRELRDIKPGEAFRLEDDKEGEPLRFILHPSRPTAIEGIQIVRNGHWGILDPDTEVWTAAPQPEPVAFRELGLCEHYTAAANPSYVAVKVGLSSVIILEGANAGTAFHNADLGFPCLRVRPVKPIEWGVVG